MLFVLFFKQKTAYEMRISDWSSDVCSSDLAGWDYSQVLPYFRKAETYERGADAYRGGDGPLQVSAGACRNPLFKAWIEAGRQAGYPVTQDMNGFQQEGFAHIDRKSTRLNSSH